LSLFVHSESDGRGLRALNESNRLQFYSNDEAGDCCSREIAKLFMYNINAACNTAVLGWKDENTAGAGESEISL